MKRGPAFVVLDLFETQSVILALDAQIRLFEARLDRAPKSERLQWRVHVDRQKALRNRLNKRFAPAMAKLRQQAGMPPEGQL